MRNSTSVDTSNQSSGDDSGSEDVESTKLPQTINFLQIGSTDSTGTLNVFSDYSDTFLIRGNNTISVLKERAKINQKNYCLGLNYSGSYGQDSKNILVVSARVRSYFNSAIKGKEYFLQISPNDEAINQGDCPLTNDLRAKLQEVYSSSQITHTIKQVCPNCNVNINSKGLRIFEPNGVEDLKLTLSHLFLNIIPSIGTPVTNAPSCSINANCSAINFNCCLAGQCVNHGQVRSNIDQTSDDYKTAINILAGHPELIKNYDHIFYVCSSMIPNDDIEPTDPVDPIGEANDLLTELKNLYNCASSNIDEFSICTKQFQSASTLMKNGPHTFEGAPDDINMSGISSSNGNNIVQIDYAGATYFKEKLLSTDSEVPLDSRITLLNKNDTLFASQSAKMQIPLPTESALNDTLTLYFKVDGTCEKLGSSLAQCKKFYTQGQVSSPARSSDHPAGNNQFNLPNYSDTTFNIIVKIGGTPIAQGIDTWTIAGKSVLFNSVTYPIQNNQKIEITYFVTSNIDELTHSKELAQTKIDAHCVCDPKEPKCFLSPVSTVVAGVERVTSFICNYPQVNPPSGPLQTTISLNAKTVPHKFYDVNGVNYDLPDQRSIEPQEGLAFTYTDGHFLKPNNVSQDIGFNEIYGTMNVDNSSPLPAKVVHVEKEKTYDIFVDQGAFSSCINCGSDYYSSMQKVFPTNFAYKGGGYKPDLVESRRRTNTGSYRGDDLRFGRACFVPATMIPWTHKPNQDVKTQRRERQAAQHHLFANGYNKDWYGFDYGSVIGSFDGVKWFAIGNQRKIKADSKKLYLAINAYFGDLTINNTFQVTISEMAPGLNSGSLVVHDSQSDGAECQKSHFCKVDNDCISNLGYDYTCTNVSAIQTDWPIFDVLGNELSGGITTSLLSLVGGSNGQAKRCVYRGRGAICEQNSLSVNAANSYTNSSEPKLHSCSQNTTCAQVSSTNFNTKIARYAEAPGSQNVQAFITDKTDTFGLGTRNLGRPYSFYGQASTPQVVKSLFTTNKINSICITGKDANNIHTAQELNHVSILPLEGDKISNVGRTISSSVLQDEYYLASCPATNENGDFTHLTNIGLNDNKHKPFAISQNISTNSLILPSLEVQNIFNDKNALVSAMGYHKNTCLRAPGARCFSDFECAPNSFIATKFKSVNNFNSEISQAEERYWEEELICGNSQPRYLENTNIANPVYETNEKKCCREVDKTFTYFSQKHENSDIKVVDSSGDPLIPGINQDYNDPKRYSRTQTVYDKLISDPTNYPSMISAAPQPISPLALTLNSIKQYNTLHLNNERMCCTGNWVRKLANGTHNFNSKTGQVIPLDTFKSLNWNPNNVPPINTFPSGNGYVPIPFTCTPDDYQTADCEIKNIIEGSTFEKKYLRWFAKFELLGIPQVLIETNTTVEKPISTYAMTLGATNIAAQQDISSYLLPIENTIKNVNTDGVIDITYDSKDYYSAASYDNFEIGSGKLKKIFKENEFNCCIPTGVEVPNNTTDSQCCTGKTATIDSLNRCCMQDFTDLSVYTNRYVSSEGANLNGQPVNDSNIDPTTGYLKKEIVIQMAQTMCCSGKATTGRVINELLIPINFDNKIPGIKTRRFSYLETLDNDTEVEGNVQKYNAGLKWNHHVYCVPAGFEEE